jgi:DNA polymerase-3 subunit delta'
VRDNLDGALLDLATVFRDALLVKVALNDQPISSNLDYEIMKLTASQNSERILKKIEAIQKARTRLVQNAYPLLLAEDLMCELLS